MKSAMDAGIPVICLERDIAEPNYTTYIRCDNHAIGKMAGEFIVKKLMEKNGSPKGMSLKSAASKASRVSRIARPALTKSSRNIRTSRSSPTRSPTGCRPTPKIE